MDIKEFQPQFEESVDSFNKRVKERTGMDFDAIPKGEREDALLPIICKRGDVYVVGYGYPDKDPETGEEIYSEFRVVDLSE